MKRIGILLLSLASFVGNCPAVEVSVDELLNSAQQAAGKGRFEDALVLATQAINVEPKNAQCYGIRGRIHSTRGDHAKAVSDFDKTLELEPKAVEVFQYRGVEHFKMGSFGKSISDFDQYIKARPEQDPYHWQRGIAYYYAGEFDKGRRQFERHQVVNANDVENAVWHFLCVARDKGLEEARKNLIPIQGDTRVPMMKVHELFAGQAKPADVLADAEAGKTSPAERNQRIFFAHLYLGLYYEATGDLARTKEHIAKSVTEFKTDNYMGDVARVHAKVLGLKTE